MSELMMMPTMQLDPMAQRYMSGIPEVTNQLIARDEELRGLLVHYAGYVFEQVEQIVEEPQTNNIAWMVDDFGRKVPQRQVVLRSLCRWFPNLAENLRVRVLDPRLEAVAERFPH